jgi:hypothetical protein
MSIYILAFPGIFAGLLLVMINQPYLQNRITQYRKMHLTSRTAKVYL